MYTVCMFKEKDEGSLLSTFESRTAAQELKANKNAAVVVAAAEMTEIGKRIRKHSSKLNSLPYDQLAFIKARVTGAISRLETAEIAIPNSLQELNTLLISLIDDEENYNASTALSSVGNRLYLADYAVKRLKVT